VPQLPPDIRPVFERFTVGPTLLRQAVDGLDPGTLNRRPAGEDWSIRDIVVHLADAELVGAVRFRLVLGEEQPILPVYDQERWKRRLHYLWRDPEAAISLFQQARYGTAELLQQCDRTAWERSGEHPERGRMTLGDLLALYAEHVEEHVEQIRRFRGG
jgi:uncharacterized damage-inducible protein DinB